MNAITKDTDILVACSDLENYHISFGARAALKALVHLWDGEIATFGQLSECSPSDVLEGKYGLDGLCRIEAVMSEVGVGWNERFPYDYYIIGPSDRCEVQRQAELALALGWSFSGGAVNVGLNRNGKMEWAQSIYRDRSK